MELGIGLADNLALQALTELRHIGIGAEQPHIASPQDSTVG